MLSPCLRNRTAALAITALALGGTSCHLLDGDDDATPATAVSAAVPRVARAAIDARSGSGVAGEAIFTEAGGMVKAVIRVTGATPGKHAVHVHEKGDCSAPDGTSAGGHFNPDGHPHGAPDAAQHHAGDFGNIDVGADGTGILEITTDDITVAPGTHSVVGRAIIVHEKPDDFGQPVGNAGGRVGCGVIAAQP